MSLLVFAFALAVGILAMYLWNLKTKNNIRISWLSYLLIAVFIVWTGVGIMVVNSFIEEAVGTAITTSLMVFGITAIALLAIIWQVITRQNRAG